MLYRFTIITLLALACAFPAAVHAAVLSLDAESMETGIGGRVAVDVVIDSEGEPVNAAEATVTFPTDILRVVELDDSDSIFNFWVEDPSYSNEDGTVSFTGGSPQGKSGDSLQVVRVLFEATGAGNAEISVSNAVVTAADGRGTNVLSTVEGAAIGVETRVVQPEPQVPREEERPQVVTRAPTEATALPDAPSVRVPLYPDPDAWHNHTGETAVLWDVPNDITRVAFAFDQSPNTVPPRAEDQLVTGKEVGQLEEGVYYAHVQFKNAIGWGETTHYRIAIDTTAPLPFAIELSDAASENPRPEVVFETQDELSGISHARIRVDNGDAIRATTTSLRLPPQEPGKHTLSIRVFDEAGNSSDDMTEFEILPIEEPTVDFLSRSVEQGEPVFVSGTALPNIFIDVAVRNEDGRIVWTGETETSGSGGWELRVEEALPSDSYVLRAAARDERGAKSYPVEREFRVRAQTILTIGAVDLGWFEIVVFFVLVVLSGVGAVGWWYYRKQDIQGAYRIVAIRDIKKMSNLIAEHNEAVERWINEVQIAKKHSRARDEALHHVQKVRETVQKIKKYISSQIERME